MARDGDGVNSDRNLAVMVEGLRRDTDRVLDLLSLRGQARTRDEVYAFLEEYRSDQDRVQLVAALLLGPEVVRDRPPGPGPRAPSPETALAPARPPAPLPAGPPCPPSPRPSTSASSPPRDGSYPLVLGEQGPPTCAGRWLTCPTERHLHCELCNKTFDKPFLLNDHRNAVHLNLRPLECSICGKTYAYSQAMARHRNGHTVTPRFNCGQCTQTFQQKCDLKRHMNTHSGGKFFPCTACGRLFGRADYISKHMNLHPADKVKCLVCGQVYRTKPDLAEHMALSHGTDLEQRGSDTDPDPDIPDDPDTANPSGPQPSGSEGGQELGEGGTGLTEPTTAAAATAASTPAPSADPGLAHSASLPAARCWLNPVRHSHCPECGYLYSASSMPLPAHYIHSSARRKEEEHSHGGEQAQVQGNPDPRPTQPADATGQPAPQASPPPGGREGYGGQGVAATVPTTELTTAAPGAAASAAAGSPSLPRASPTPTRATTGPTLTDGSPARGLVGSRSSARRPDRPRVPGDGPPSDKPPP